MNKFCGTMKMGSFKPISRFSPKNKGIETKISNSLGTVRCFAYHNIAKGEDWILIEKQKFSDGNLKKTVSIYHGPIKIEGDGLNG